MTGASAKIPLILVGVLWLGLAMCEDDPQPASKVVTIQHNAIRKYWLFMGATFL
jgi:hypothetical protein